MAVSQCIEFSFDSLLYSQRYTPDRFNIAKIRKRTNSINTDDRVMVLAFIALYHFIKFHLFIFNTFRAILQASLLLQKLGREITL